VEVNFKVIQSSDARGLKVCAWITKFIVQSFLYKDTFTKSVFNFVRMTKIEEMENEDNQR
jgi:hypothetical protein